ncbi:MAG: DUF4097 family beta strand repeat-containing protein [Acidobacteriota bacterium]
MTAKVLTGAAAIALAVSASAIETRSLSVRLDGDPAQAWAVENLAGTMTVTPTDGNRAEAIATVHAESAALADAVRFEQVKGDDGRPVLRLIYPRNERQFRYPGHGSTTVEYVGRRVEVSGHGGPELWAEVEVRVPRAAVHAAFRNLVGPVSAQGVRGRVRLDSASGDIAATDLSGDISADTGSGDIRAEKIDGSFECDTGSGACLLTGFHGEQVGCDTGSGAITVRQVAAHTLEADTGSGAIRVEGADLEEFWGDTGSGRISLEVTGSRLRRVRADTGSGDIEVRVPPDTGFELDADQGSGDLACGFGDARPVVHERLVVDYTRGDRRVSVSVNTGSGDVSILPVR